MDGFTISPMVILNAASHREQWIPNTVENSVLYGLSESGYSNAELALEWIKHFDRFTTPRQRGLYRLLLFDGHDSHTTFEFINFCDKRKIIPFALPPHSTHFLQPLDITLFQPYKHWHGRELDDAARTGCTNFNRAEFINRLQSIRKRTFKESTILSAWREAGLSPYNPTAILAPLQCEADIERERRLFDDPIIEDRYQTPSDHSSSQITTPITVRTIRRYGKKILDGPSSHSRFEERLETFIKSSVATAHLATELKDDISPLACLDDRTRKLDKELSGSRIVVCNRLAPCVRMTTDKPRWYC